MLWPPPCTRLASRRGVQGGAARDEQGDGEKGSEHEGHESTRNTRKEVLSASRLSCLSRPFAAFVIQTAPGSVRQQAASRRGVQGGEARDEQGDGDAGDPCRPH